MPHHRALLRIASLILIPIGLAWASQTVRAQVSIFATDSGWYNEAGTHDATNKNYVAGRSTDGTTQYRNFFVFDLSGASGTVTAARLAITNPAGFGNGGTDYTLYDVTTPLSTLIATNAGRTDIYNDLGGGTAYGSIFVSNVHTDPIVVPLGPAGVAAVQSTLGGYFAVGGDFPSGDSLLFGNSGQGAPPIQVRLILDGVKYRPLIISEFRLRGPNGAADEFVELYNNTNSPFAIQADDSSGGWAVVGADGVFRFAIPNFTSIPARGHYLAVVFSGYSLGAYASPNDSYTPDIADNTGVALFRSRTLPNFTSAFLADAVGFAGAPPLYTEGTPLAPIPVADVQHSFVRKLTSGRAQDTDDNASDFVLVATDGNATLPGATLGAPGPENRSSPVQRNAALTASLVDPQQVSTAPPNRVRDFTSGGTGTPAEFGTLSIRRRFKNTTNQAVTRLRFRIVDITTAPAPVGTADLRALAGQTGSFTVTLTGGGTATVQRLTLEQPPTQALGGGLNSSLAVGTITPGTPLSPGASLNVEFLLGVAQTGSFRFFVNVEALPTPTGIEGAPANQASSKLPAPDSSSSKRAARAPKSKP